MKEGPEFIIRWINYRIGDVSLIMPTVYVLALFILALLIVWGITTLWCHWRFKKWAKLYIREANQEREDKINELRRLHEGKIELIKELRKELATWKRAGAKLQVFMHDASKVIQEPTRVKQEEGE